jgi:hypothetical protein
MPTPPMRTVSIETEPPSTPSTGKRILKRLVLDTDPMHRRKLLDRPLPVVAVQPAVLLAAEWAIREVVRPRRSTRQLGREDVSLLD